MRSSNLCVNEKKRLRVSHQCLRGGEGRGEVELAETEEEGNWGPRSGDRKAREEPLGSQVYLLLCNKPLPI